MTPEFDKWLEAQPCSQRYIKIWGRARWRALVLPTMRNILIAEWNKQNAAAPQAEQRPAESPKGDTIGNPASVAAPGLMDTWNACDAHGILNCDMCSAPGHGWITGTADVDSMNWKDDASPAEDALELPPFPTVFTAPLPDTERYEPIVRGTDYDALRRVAEGLKERYGYSLDDGLRKSKMYNEVAEQLAEAEQRCAALEQELRGMREDAGRYHWLRSNPNFMGWEPDFLPNQVDSEVDAARAADGQGGEEK